MYCDAKKMASADLYFIAPPTGRSVILASASMATVKQHSSTPGGECTAAALPATAPTLAPAARKVARRQSTLPSLQGSCQQAWRLSCNLCDSAGWEHQPLGDGRGSWIAALPMYFIVPATAKAGQARAGREDTHLGRPVDAYLWC
jgi:hypothetical protein